MQSFVEKDNFFPWETMVTIVVSQGCWNHRRLVVLVLLLLFSNAPFQLVTDRLSAEYLCSRYLTQCSATCSSQQKSWPRECIPYQSLLLPSLCALILMLSLVLCLCLLFPDISHAIGTRRAIGAGNEVDTTVSQNRVSVIISMRRANVATSRSSSSTCIPQSGLAAFGNTWVLDCNITNVS